MVTSQPPKWSLCAKKLFVQRNSKRWIQCSQRPSSFKTCASNTHWGLISLFSITCMFTNRSKNRDFFVLIPWKTLPATNAIILNLWPVSLQTDLFGEVWSSCLCLKSAHQKRPRLRIFNNSSNCLKSLTCNTGTPEYAGCDNYVSCWYYEQTLIVFSEESDCIYWCVCLFAKYFVLRIIFAMTSIKAAWC